MQTTHTISFKQFEAAGSRFKFKVTCSCGWESLVVSEKWVPGHIDFHANSQRKLGNVVIIEEAGSDGK